MEYIIDMTRKLRLIIKSGKHDLENYKRRNKFVLLLQDTALNAHWNTAQKHGQLCIHFIGVHNEIGSPRIIPNYNVFFWLKVLLYNPPDILMFIYECVWHYYVNYKVNI